MASRFRRYDQGYFDKWYRDPAHRVSTPASTRRKVALAVAMAEYYLERPIRTVLDVGAGEGQWQPILNRLRPGVHYTGVDPSEYAVRRFGRRRHLLLGSLGDIPSLDLRSSYDLIVCSNSLYYIPADELEPGLHALLPLLGGVAFLEAYAHEEPLCGDTRTIERRPASYYRRLFRRLGLVACGSHCYVNEVLAGCVTDLERGGV